MKRYLIRSIGAIRVLAVTPAIPPEIKLFKDFSEDPEDYSCTIVFLIIIEYSKQHHNINLHIKIIDQKSS